MKTNRQWLESLTDRQLAKFLTLGLQVRSLHYHTEPFIINIAQISTRYTASIAGVEVWLSEPQEYEIEKGSE
jgi:hypothetical protein